jgi:hypothetical protein
MDLDSLIFSYLIVFNNIWAIEALNTMRNTFISILIPENTFKIQDLLIEYQQFNSIQIKNIHQFGFFRI